MPARHYLLFLLRDSGLKIYSSPFVKFKWTSCVRSDQFQTQAFLKNLFFNVQEFCTT